MTTPVADKPIEEQPLSGVFNPDEYDWPTHVKKALESLKVKTLEIDRVWNYYDGKHPRVWLTDAIRDQLDDELITDMAENYCDTAVDAPVKRLSVEGFVNPDDSSIEVSAADNIWDDNKLDLGQKDLYTEARAVGEAFLFIWKDEEKPAGIDITQVDARRVWWPDDCHRADPTRVVQIWADEEDGVWRATCYYKFVVVRLVGPRLKDGGNSVLPTSARYFTIDPEDPGGEHGFEGVPVVRFARHKRRMGIIQKIKNLQDKINKLSANLLVSAEFNAWRKTIIMTEQTIEDGDLKFRPNRALVLDPGGGEGGVAATSIWEGSATELANYSDEIDKNIDKLFTKAVLPGHMKVKSTNTAPSGAAYEADEGPFVEDIEDMQKAYGASWHELFELAVAADVNCQWRNPAVKSDSDEMTTVKTATEAGVPLRLALRKYAGWTKEELDDLDNEPLSAKEQLSMAAAAALANGGGMADGEAQPNGGDPQTPPDNNGGASGQPTKPAQGSSPFGKG